MDKYLALFASWIVTADLRTSGLVKAIGASIVAWSEALLVERARQHLASRSPAWMHDPQGPLASMLRVAPPMMPTEQIVGHQIAKILGETRLIIFGNALGIIVDVHIGQPGASQSVDELRWKKLIAGGVELLPWPEIVRLRVALGARVGGVA